MNNNIVITISRQYGSGGRELSQILSKKMELHLYDRQIIHIAAAQLDIGDLSEKNLKNLEENVEPYSLNFMPFYSFGTHSRPIDKELFITEAKVIRKLAEDNSCIILGRCADFVLQDLSNHYSFFICADDNYREQRGKSIYKGKSLKELKSEDKKRAKYYKFYTGEKWGNPENYDLVINTAKMSLEKVIDLIIEYINLMKNK